MEAENWNDYVGLTAAIMDIERSRLAQLLPHAPRLHSCDEKSLFHVASSLRLPITDPPQVTIVIPVHDNGRLLLECLLSVERDQSFTSYEVCIVDDHSGPETRELIDSIPRVTVIRNEQRMGFAASCNKGAREARGAFLLFLNDDVQVMPGWLAALLDTFAHESRAGAVGPKVLYPSGRLQEAGCSLKRDGTTSLVGHGDDPNLPRYNYPREVDYVSGVCLLLRTDDFRQMGGFDSLFGPAYYEDVDLCLRLREEGKRIYYNPAAVIVHHLSATTSALLGQDAKLITAAANRQKFLERWQQRVDEMQRVRLIAFYLPQFHPIPENDLWWGTGFSEWHKVTQARPNFEGHYQPHLPADLGFYDLRVPEIMEQQASLAKRYGIEGFCYYYYWFNGKRLLEMPLERMLATGRPDFPFCLCWANENWSRRWDGNETDLLISQSYSEQDDLAVIRDLIRYFQSPNYIRVDGKPILLVYRVPLFPNFRATARLWREECRKAGIGDIHLVMVETFELSLGSRTAREFGVDAAVAFPPHGHWEPIRVPNLSPSFAGSIVDYQSLALKYSLRGLPGHIRYETVMPCWDNTPRKQDTATIVAHSSPGAYQAWLAWAIRRAREQHSGDHRIVFLNAWNEWAEGNHLEPDQRYGHQYLASTANALEYDLLHGPS